MEKEDINCEQDIEESNSLFVDGWLYAGFASDTFNGSCTRK